MKYIITTSILLLNIITSHCQNDTLFLFFEKDDYTIAHTNLIEDKIKKLLRDYDKKIEVSLYGYTDSDGEEDYNTKLAKNRIKSVENILANYPNLSIFQIIPYGEKGKRLTTKLKNRRVEVIFHIPEKQDSNIISTSLQSNIDTIIPPKNEKIYKDSLLTFPSGMEVSIDKALVATLDTTNGFSQFKIIDQSISYESRTASGYTQDIYGNPLTSAGMFTVIMKNNKGEDTCAKTPVTILTPVREDGCYNPEDMQPWQDSGRGWRRTNAFRIKIVEINGKKYFEAKVFCPGTYNIDGMPASVFKIKLKPSMPSTNYVLTSVILSDECQTIRLQGKSKNNNTIKIKVPCIYSGLYAQYYFHHKDSSTIYLSDKIPLYKHKKRLEYGFCKAIDKKGRSKTEYLWPKRRRLVIKIRNFTELQKAITKTK